MSTLRSVWLCALVSLGGCAALQTGENTLQMAEGISRIRDVQVLRNISSAISDHDMVPSQIVLVTGQATVATGATPTTKLTNSDALGTTKELGLGVTDTWTAQWQFASVTNADDLRRLRNLYALVASTGEQYKALTDYFVRHPKLRARGSEGQPGADGTPAEGLESSLATAPPPGDANAHRTPVGSRAGNVALWEEALRVMRIGDSIGCKLYQEQRDADPNMPFRRWLYWREPGAEWLPAQPTQTPESLGTFGDWEIGVTSRACFNDFVILVQGQTPVTEKQSAQGARVMLGSSP